MNSNQILLLVTVIVLILVASIGGCGGYYLGKQTCSETISVKRDTVLIYRDTSLQIAKATPPKPKKTNQSLLRKALVNVNGSSIKYKTDTLPCDTLRIITKELIAQIPDTTIYSDTIRHNEVKAVVNDTVIGRIIGRSVFLANLRPEMQIKETVVKKVKQWTLYGIIQIPTNGKQVNVIPTIEVTTPFGLCFGYGYQIGNNMHVPNVGYAFTFKQK